MSDLLAEPNRTVIVRLDDRGVRPGQQLLWQVELPRLVKEVQPLLGHFHDGVIMGVTLQIL